MDSPCPVSEMLELQISEVEMLRSIFPDSTEFQLDDPCAIADIQTYLDGKTLYSDLTSRIGFTAKVAVDGWDQDKLEIVCHLPHEYPSVPPEVFLRAPHISKQSHSQLNEQVQKHILELEKGELVIYPVIQWLQENAGCYFQVDSSNTSQNSAPTKVVATDVVFSRIWIYSHHIYSKIKRKDILDLSHELQLTGFCMPGKPGVICVEGFRCQSEDFWHTIRRWQWKKIGMKHREDMDIKGEVNGLRKFEKFEEKHFEPRQGKGRGAHMDRGLFFQFLEKRGCAEMFQILFGVEGKTAESDSD